MTDAEPVVRKAIRKGRLDPVEKLEILRKELERQLAAEQLLKKVLGEDEYDEFLNSREIRIASKKFPNRYYVVREMGRIEVIENDIIVDKLCINPAEANYPIQDQLVAKKLGLEAAEELILRTANHMSVPYEGFWEKVREVIPPKDLNLDFFSKQEEILALIRSIMPNEEFDTDMFSEQKDILSRIRTTRETKQLKVDLF